MEATYIDKKAPALYSVCSKFYSAESGSVYIFTAVIYGPKKFYEIVSRGTIEWNGAAGMTQWMMIKKTRGTYYKTFYSLNLLFL